MVLSGSLEEQADGRRQPLPRVELAFELLPPIAGQAVDLGGASTLGLLPLRRDPSLVLEAVQRGIERSLSDRELLAGEGLDALGDRPAVQRLARDRLEDEQVEGALQQVGGLGHGLTRIPRLSTMRHTSTIDNEVAMHAIRVAPAIFTLAAAGAAQSRPAHPAPATPKAVTFSEDIAPILYQHCVTCHRPGEVAPFTLITFEDAVKRGKSLVKVTESRVMPPWHAAHGYGEFADERRLTDAQIAVIRDWVEHGMKRGDAAKMPPLPTFTDGWQLGTPDLILEMPEAFEVPASGPDIYRNFVLPTGMTEDRWIKAIEYRPGTRTVVHHSLFQYIRGGAAAKLVNADGQPGYRGAMPVAFVPGFAPAGELGAWAVGATPRALPEGLALPLPKGSDFVLQLHLHPTGKP